MTLSSQPILIGAVAAVGVLHTVVPDHWLPITVIARQRGWSSAETARGAFQAGIGHVLSTLTIAFAVWIVGIEVAKRFGAYIDAASSIALIGFGLWVTALALHNLDHHHSHSHDYDGMQSDQANDTIVHTNCDGDRQQASQTALVLILGSSPMVEGIPAFFAASKYGVGLIFVMSAVFAASTIATYVLLSVCSTIGLRHIRFGPLERYGEVLSGATIAIVGLTFWIWSGRR